MLGQLAGEGEHGRGGALRAQREGAHRGTVVLAHGRVGDLPAHRLGEQARRGLDARAKTVLAHDPSGEGVVRRDGRLADELGIAAEPSQRPGQVKADAVRQLAGGLPGEGEAEHLVRADVLVSDEPHHPKGHQLRLARAGAGDDEQRLIRRCGDDRLLLGAELIPQPEQPAQFLRREAGADG